jgi:hypothetical protein
VQRRHGWREALVEASSGPSRPSPPSTGRCPCESTHQQTASGCSSARRLTQSEARLVTSNHLMAAAGIGLYFCASFAQWARHYWPGRHPQLAAPARLIQQGPKLLSIGIAHATMPIRNLPSPSRPGASLLRGSLDRNVRTAHRGTGGYHCRIPYQHMRQCCHPQSRRPNYLAHSRHN